MENQVPEGFELDYTMSTGQPVAPTIVGGVPQGFSLDYEMPSDKLIKVPQEVVKQVTQDPVMKKPDVTIGNYIDSTLDSWIGNIRKDYEESVRQSSAAIERGMTGKQTKLETGFQVVGDTFNLLGDAIGETVITVAGTAGDAISFLTPDSIENPIKEGAKDTWDYIVNTPTGQMGLNALASGMDAWLTFEKENPRAAENIKSVVDIGLFVNPANTTGIKAARNQTAETLQKASVIRRVKGMKADVGKGTRVGLDVKYLDSMSNTKAQGYMDRTRSINKEISPTEQEAVDALQGLRGYSPAAEQQKALIQNHRVVDEALIEAKAARDAVIESSVVRVNPTTVYKNVGTAMDDLLRNAPDPDVLGRTVNAAYAEMERLVGMHGTTPKGLDAVRRGLNEWEKLHSRTPQIDSVLGAIRGQLRTIVDDIAPGYKEAQARVAGLTKAKIGIGEKLSTDAGNALINFLDHALATVGLSRDVAFIGTVGGVSYATSSLPILMAGGALLGGYKLSTLAHKGLRQDVGQRLLSSLQNTTAQIIKTSKDGKVIKDVKAAEQALREVIKSAMENYKEGGLSSEEFYAEQERMRQENAADPMQPLEVTVPEGNNMDEVNAIIDRNQGGR